MQVRATDRQFMEVLAVSNAVRYVSNGRLVSGLRHAISGNEVYRLRRCASNQRVGNCETGSSWAVIECGRSIALPRAADYVQPHEVRRAARHLRSRHHTKNIPGTNP